jgi:hypothetical protein
MKMNEFLKKEEELDRELSSIWGEYSIVDGITDYAKYDKCNTKILWILREPNTGGIKQKWNHRVFHKDDYTKYNKWKATYKNIILVSYGILKGMYKVESILPDFDEKSGKIGDSNVLEEIAIINVKKTGGKSTSNRGELNREYARPEVKEFLFKQIEFIKPDIIINAHGITAFTDDQEEILKERLIIKTYHPAQTRLPRNLYCNNTLNLVQKTKSQHAGG